MPLLHPAPETRGDAGFSLAATTRYEEVNQSGERTLAQPSVLALETSRCPGVELASARMEPLERRALVILVVVALLFLRAAGLYPTPTWLTAIYILGIACLTAASLLLVVVIAPPAYIGRWDSERPRLLFYAFALVVGDVIVTAVIFAYSAYATNAHF